jgi:two-component system, OmpR family, response regulator RpaA
MVYPGARAARDPDRKELEPSRKSRSPRRPADGRETARATWPRASKGVDERMKTVFTTGEAAKICKVSQQTIIRCFDNGQLKGFRVPGSRFRRIPREALYKFMKDNGIPTDALESGKRKVLLVDDDAELVELILKFLDEDGRFETRVAQNGFDAGMMVKEYHPDLIVLDVMLPDINGKEVCQRVRADDTLEQVKIICISGMVEQDKVADLRAAGADDFLQKPFTVDKLLDRSCDLLEMEKAVMA